MAQGKKQLQDKSLYFLFLTFILYLLAYNTSSIFLPNYFLGIGLSIGQIVVIGALLFLILGLVPIVTLKYAPKIFEKLLIPGILLLIVFYILLFFVKSPLLLGLTWGLSWAAFWPAFNLLLYRLTSIKRRGLVISIFYVVVTTITGVVGPAMGGFLISLFSFAAVFVFGIVMLLLAFVFSLKVRYAPATGGFVIPRSNLLLLFGAIIIVSGFSDPTFFAYPLLLHHLTSGYLEMGIVATVVSIIFAVVSVVVGKLSQVEKHRIDFAFFGTVVFIGWLFALAFVQNIPELVVASTFGGISSAFTFLVFALFGDFFKRKQHATLVVLWEVFLMVGRLANLAPLDIFVGNSDFKDYFLVVGLVSLIVIVFFMQLRRLYRRGEIKTDTAQRSPLR